MRYHAAPGTTSRLVKRNVWLQERKNKTHDLVVLLVRWRKMASVEEMDLGVRQVALERLAAWTLMNEGSFRPQTTSVGGLCSRSHACHAGYEATFVW